MSAKRLGALVLAAAALLIPAACNGDTLPAAESPAPASISASPPGDDAPTAAPPVPADPGSMDLAGGRHPAFITGIDAAGRSVTFDVIQFLTGREAIDAYRNENPDDPDGPPNDYYIVNSNSRLRTGALAEDAGIRLVKMEQDAGADLDEATLEELVAYLEPGERSTVPFWITIDEGRITAIDEQFVP